MNVFNSPVWLCSACFHPRRQGHDGVDLDWNTIEGNIFPEALIGRVQREYGASRAL
jgi:hypothetical protein